jgi:hypothetical protein
MLKNKHRRNTTTLHRRILTFVLTAVLAVLAPAGAAQADVAPDAALALDGPYYLVNRNGKVLAPSGNDLVVSGSRGSSRYFNTVPDNGYITYEHNESKRNVNTSGNVAGARAVLSAPSGSFTQDWSTVPIGSGSAFFGIENRGAPGMCLGISGGSGGTDVAIFPCDRARNQQWKLERA